jgi:hypothetical protein
MAVHCCKNLKSNRVKNILAKKHFFIVCAKSVFKLILFSLIQKEVDKKPVMLNTNASEHV